MKITLQDIGKKFNRQWIFREVNCVFEPKKTYALIGGNGSGKSTLLQIIYNFQTISKGKIIYTLNQQVLEESDLVQKMAIAAPYLELLEEFTLLEMVHFHFGFLKLQEGVDFEAIISACGLAGSEHKFIKHFSSGMKQRLKLALALYSESPVLLLDEPCSNLDEQGINWYRMAVQQQLGKRTIIIASNQNYEYDFCDETIQLQRFKNFNK